MTELSTFIIIELSSYEENCCVFYQNHCQINDDSIHNINLNYRNLTPLIFHTLKNGFLYSDELYNP